MSGINRIRAGGVLSLDLTKSSDWRRLSHGLQTHLLIEMLRRGRRERMFVVSCDGRYLKEFGSILMVEKDCVYAVKTDGRRRSSCGAG